MAKLSSYRRIYSQDYEGQFQGLVDKLGIPLNQSFSELYDALNNKLTFADNFNCTIASFNVTTDANGTPSNTTQFKLATTQTTFSGLFVIGATGGSDGLTLPSGAIFISAKKSDNYIIINSVLGLKPNISYNIKVIALS